MCQCSAARLTLLGCGGFGSVELVEHKKTKVRRIMHERTSCRRFVARFLSFALQGRHQDDMLARPCGLPLLKISPHKYQFRVAEAFVRLS